MLNESAMKINGELVSLDCEPRTSLADFLRDEGKNSVHLGCEHGVCGSCNVLVDGECVRACLVLAQSCDEAEVVTLEGLNDELAQQLRAAFNRHHALQCGFCTPGVFVAAYELLARGLAIDEAQVRQHMAGNICRCTGYQGIVEAILAVAQSYQPGAEPALATDEPTGKADQAL